MSLACVVDPKALLLFHTSCSIGTECTFLLDALATCTINNAEYAHDVIAVWAYQHRMNIPYEDTQSKKRKRTSDAPFTFGDTLSPQNLNHAAHAILSSMSTEYVGAVLLDHAAKCLKKNLKVVLLPKSPIETETRLCRLVVNAAKDCQFDKRGDRFLWNLLRFALAPHIESGTFDVAPYAAIAKAHGANANDVVGAWTSTMPADLPTKINYASGSPNNLVVVAGILGEHLDDVDMWVRVNGDMLRNFAPCLAAFHGIPSLSDTTGVFDGTTFFAAHDATPVTSVLLKWAEVVDVPASTLLLDALTKPTNHNSKLSMMAAVI